jgi:hypothetical protein
MVYGAVLLLPPLAARFGLPAAGAAMQGVAALVLCGGALAAYRLRFGAGRAGTLADTRQA